MKKFILIIIFSTVFLVGDITNINAISKKDMPYEINSIVMDSRRKRLVINGWGFISNAQNYKNASTHEYNLILQSNNEQLVIKGTTKNVNHTNTMEYFGSPWCNDQDFYKEVHQCNNSYANIGFTFYVMLSDLKMGQDYKASLNIIAKTANSSKTIPIHFLIKEHLILENNKVNYIIDSKLNDISLKVATDYVVVKDEAGKAGSILETKLNCSNTNVLYFKKHESFYNIFDIKFLDNITYYKLGAKEIGCFANYPFVGEGSDLYPVWIASNFVDYKGEQLTIKVRVDNKFPEIFVKNDIVVYVDDKVDFLLGVSAYDFEDGDLSHKLQIISNDFKNEAGHYKIRYLVVDSQGFETSATRSITVLNKNYPPIINASDVEVKQFTFYDPYFNVTAYDQDMTNITHLLKTMNTIDTSIVSKQAQCYEVTDFYNLTTSKCITVNVVRAKSNFRFISIHSLFYKEEIPKIWIDKLGRLNSQITNEIAYSKKTISK